MKIRWTFNTWCHDRYPARLVRRFILAARRPAKGYTGPELMAHLRRLAGLS